MKIVIAGAGDLGFHLARLLASEQQDITLIDTNPEVLDFAETHLDVITIRGNSSAMEILELAEVRRASLVIAVTTTENNNLVTAILAKKMGAKQTIARVSNTDYLKAENRGIFEELGIDSLISPRMLAAKEIKRLVAQSNFTDIFDFEEGRFSVFGITLERDFPVVNKSVEHMTRISEGCQFKLIALLRGNNTILPRSYTILHQNDHLYFTAKKGDIPKILDFFGKEKRKVKKIMVAGGTPLGYQTAQMLEDEYNVTLVEGDKPRCKMLAENLSHTLVINADPSNINLLKDEGLKDMDVYIGVTPNTETNVLTCLLAKDLGVHKTIAMVENIEYTHISQNIGIDTMINKKLISANNIFRFVRKGKIEAIASLHGVDAEIIEFVIHKDNRITKKPLRELHLPEKTIIGGVIRKGQSIIPTGDFTLEVDDKLIVFAMPDAIGKLERLFR